MNRSDLTRARCWVIKLGSALVTDHGRGLDGAALDSWVEQVVALRAAGHQVILVSSGSVAEGMARLGWRDRPQGLHLLQAAAAVGQMGLVQAYETRFKRFGLTAGQVLLTHDEVSDRTRYLNARSTLRALLELGVIAVVNENDTVASDSFRFGDNDTLAALTVNLVEADVLVILTDRAGLYDADPSNHPNAKLIRVGRAGDRALEAAAAGGMGPLGRGGMRTKIKAAAWAARSGATTIIAHGREDKVLERIHAGEELGTMLIPGQARLAARKRWIAGHLRLRGELQLDSGAAEVVCKSGRSLLPVGVTDVRGDFQRGDVVACISPSGEEVARGLVNYDSAEVRRLLRRSSREISTVLGYQREPELIHRDNLVIH